MHNTVGPERMKTPVQDLRGSEKKYNLTVDSSDHVIGIKPLPCPIITMRNIHKKHRTNHTFNFLQGNVCHKVLEITHIYKMGNYMKKAIDLEYFTYLVMTQQSRQHWLNTAQFRTLCHLKNSTGEFLWYMYIIHKSPVILCLTPLPLSIT
jgi:hypothetical protein